MKIRLEVYGDSDDPDQTAQSCSLIRVIAVRLNKQALGTGYYRMKDVLQCLIML